MTNVYALPTQELQSVETKLIRMRELDDSIKVLEAEYKMLKEELIATHFATNQEYKTSKGLLLATYKGSIERRFDSSAFSKDFPEEYDAYKKESVVYKFLLKK